jgi:GNAT superfamily N-acetyltransferase
MAQQHNPAATDAAVNAYRDSIFRLIELSPGMCGRQGDAGTRLAFTGLPVSDLNAIWPSQEPDLDEVEVFAKELSASGVPWSIQVRGEADPALLDLAVRYGRTSSETHPFLVCDDDVLSSLVALPARVPSGATVRELSGEDHEAFASASARGFGLPKEMADVLASPALLDAPDMTAFVVEVDGEAVASGFNFIAGDQLGMFSGSVAPEHRRKGYYRALVLARLRHAVASGARHAFTVNTPMSRPLYESLGFRLAEMWTYLGPE